MLKKNVHLNVNLKCSANISVYELVAGGYVGSVGLENQFQVKRGSECDNK